MSAHTGRRVLLNTTSLTAASFWRIATSFVTQLLVARLLTPAALGDFALMLAWLHIAQVATEAGLPAWMVRELAGKAEARRSLWRHVLALQLSLALLSASALIATAWFLPVWMPPLALVAIAAASLPFYAVMSATLALFEASESFHLVFVVDATVNALLLLCTALLLWLGYGLAAIFTALTLLQLFSALFALWIVRRSRLVQNRAPVSRDTLPSWPATLRASASYFTLSLTDVLQQRADLLLLGALLSPTTVGLYAAASSIVRVLIKLIQAYWRALFPTLSRQREEGYLGNTTSGHTQLATLGLRYGGFLVTGVTLVVAFLAPWLVPLLFGSDFADASALLAIMVWSAPFYLWEGYAITLLLVERRANAAAKVTILHLALLVAVLLLLVWQWGALGGAVANVLAAAGAALLGAWLLRDGNQTQSRGVLVRLLVAALIALGGGVVVRGLLADSGASIPAIALGSAIVALILYLALSVGVRLLRAEDASRVRRSLARVQ